jgi:hypothetical protein
MAVTFTTIVRQAPGLNATGLPVPDDAVRALGASRKPSVTVTIGDYTYRSTVAVRDRGFILPLSAAHRGALGLAAGDPVTVTLETDSAERTVEVPADLAAALDESSGLRSAFDSLPPSRRAALVAQVNTAKATQTRERRVASIVRQLSTDGAAG